VAKHRRRNLRDAKGTPPAVVAPKRWNTDVYICTALVILVLGIYFQVIRYSFINYDDVQYISSNYHVRSGISYQNILWALRASPDGNWFPLTWASHMFVYQLFGANADGIILLTC
jgi:hypothetical protein